MGRLSGELRNVRKGREKISWSMHWAIHCTKGCPHGGPLSARPQDGAWYDLKTMYFLLQYQNKSFSQSYQAICASRFDGWWPAQLRSPNTEEKNRAEQNRWQWDYAMILVDRSSTTGYYQKWTFDWQGRYRGATATGYPMAMLGGQIIQIAYGDILFPNPRNPNTVALRHNRADLTQGSSGGAW